MALIRPGYDDGAGNLSSGELHGRFDNYTAANIDAVAVAVRKRREPGPARVARDGSRRRGRGYAVNAWMPVCARPRINAWMSCVPS